ncbi:MAG TPA: histidine kinase [Thermoanaerobaculia bacterium]|nr:histidine kinase [Thermoanaerobaculia bacterium]
MSSLAGIGRTGPIERSIDPAVRLTRDRGLWLWVVLAWLLIGTFNTSGVWLVNAWGERGYPVMPLVAYGFGDALVWVGLTWVIFYTTDTMASSPVPRLVRLAVIAFVIIAVATTVMTTEITLGRVLLFGDEPRDRTIEVYLRARTHRDLFDAFMLFVIAGATRLRSWSAQRELRAAQLETELAKAKTQVLASQMQPHFLFNTLHAISSLTADDPGKAQLMITRLGEMLRASMEATSNEVPLADEIAFAERYVDIQKMRFGDRLTMHWSIDPRALDAAVPHLLLQPLIENAIKYGIARSDDGGTVEVHAARNGTRLRISVVNDVCDDDSAAVTPGSGQGLSNLRERLHQLYGAEASLRFERGERVIVTVDLPLDR